MQPNMPELISSFHFTGTWLEAAPYGGGHINDTYALSFRQADDSVRRYILQRINQQVFKQPVDVMHNMTLVTNHLRQQITAAGGDPTRETITLIPSVTGSTCYYTKTGDCWRAEILIECAQTFETPQNPEQLYHAAQAFGRFQKYLANLPAQQIRETIPNFHHTPRRFDAFVRAVEQDAANRAQETRAEIDFVLARANDTQQLIKLLEQDQLPERVIHNDTKLNNVLMDNQTGAGLCVIDLDTVMPGLVAYDFGDMVRAGATTAAEDEPDLAQVTFELPLYEQLVRGYLATARDFLTPLEIETLAFGARLITLEQMIRFLTDYLKGDVYYKTHYPRHNLDRCRTQLKLVAEMERHYDQMQAIVNKYR